MVKRQVVQIDEKKCDGCGLCVPSCAEGAIRLIDGKGKEFVAISVGYSILNRTATIDVGSLMLKYGGGGHRAVGTCQVPCEHADHVLKEIVEICKL